MFFFDKNKIISQFTNLIKRNEDETVYKWWLEDKGKANEKEKEEDEDGDDEDEDDEDEDGGRASIENDGQVKWTTLQHSGVLFPPLYSPHNVNLIYNGFFFLFFFINCFFKI